MEEIIGSLGTLFVLSFFLIYTVILPGTLTLWNVYNFFVKEKRYPKITLLLTMGIGLLEYVFLYQLLWETAGDYDKQIYDIAIHYSIASDYCLSFALPIALGFLGLMVLGLIPADRLSPIVSAVATAWVVVGNIVGCVFAAQIWSGNRMPEVLWLYLYHFNMLVLSVTHVRKVLREQVEILNERNRVFRHGWMRKLYPLISGMSRMRAFYFLMLFPVAGILEILLILFGQGADGVVKAFTMTADWTFSTQVPPPPVEYEGHYLCTVAAGGHRKIVKPIRYGMRRGEKIVVNRQLCIANAFEELIQERMPRFHRAVRGFYDAHGYPLSRLITTPARADFVYLLMKPLEWIFLGGLYLLDVNPERRIARQYQGKESR